MVKTTHVVDTASHRFIGPLRTLCGLTECPPSWVRMMDLGAPDAAMFPVTCSECAKAVEKWSPPYASAAMYERLGGALEAAQLNPKPRGAVNWADEMNAMLARPYGSARDFLAVPPSNEGALFNPIGVHRIDPKPTPSSFFTSNCDCNTHGGWAFCGGCGRPRTIRVNQQEVRAAVQSGIDSVGKAHCDCGTPRGRHTGFCATLRTRCCKIKTCAVKTNQPLIDGLCPLHFLEKQHMENGPGVTSLVRDITTAAVRNHVLRIPVGPQPCDNDEDI